MPIHRLLKDDVLGKSSGIHLQSQTYKIINPYRAHTGVGIWRFNYEKHFKTFWTPQSFLGSLPTKYFFSSKWWGRQLFHVFTISLEYEIPGRLVFDTVSALLGAFFLFVLYYFALFFSYFAQRFCCTFRPLSSNSRP